MIRIPRRRLGVPLRLKEDLDDYGDWGGGGGGGTGGGGSGSEGGGSKAPRPFKHIILGIDGTWQAAFSDVFHSNVFRLNVALNYRDKTPNKNSQIFIYSSGLGTMSKSGSVKAGALGEGFDQSVLHAYINLVSNYTTNDKIYIFGFSRGAVTARALTGFITHSGLLKASSSSHIEHAWNYFTKKKQTFDYASQVGNITHQDVKIEFLGIWDTVSGPHKQDELLKKYRFTSRKLDPNVKHGIHIISVDESRSHFEPIVWSGRSEDDQVLEQIWMPGVHGDIGGGYENAFLSTVSLITMIDKLAQYYPNLSFDQKYIEQSLVQIVKKEDIVVNDEWKDYGGKYFAKTSYRSGTAGTHASAHPLLKLMLSKILAVKGKDRPYNPPQWKGGSLADTKFAPDSWYSQKLETILKRKLANTHK